MKSFVLMTIILLLGCARGLAQDASPPAVNPEGVPNLSDKLNSTNGIIRPESNIDPGIRKPAPAEGSMPIIPPPGSPGGRQDIEPK